MAEHRRPLHAQIVLDARSSSRHIVRFSSSAVSASDETRVLIHDLSQTGLRLETFNGLDLGETLIVELPYVGQIEARIVRRDKSIRGAEFLTPISKAAVSAALLRSRPIPPVEGDDASVEEISLGKDPSIDEIVAFAQDIEENRGVTGDRLLGFKQAPDATLIALVLKSD